MADTKKAVRSLADQHAEAEWIVTDTPQANALAAVTKAAEANVQHYITAIHAGYGTTEIVGLLIIRDGGSEGSGGTVVWQTYVHEAAHISFDKPIPITKGNAFFVELAAGGAGNSGVVAVAGHSLA